MSDGNLAAGWFRLKAADDKIERIESVVAALLTTTGTSRGEKEPAEQASSVPQPGVFVPPHQPGRDVEVLETKRLPLKGGLSTVDGQARLLHDVANIELQAMELAVRTLAECPDAHREFQEELAELAIDEARHLRLCLKALSDMGRPWGTWPVSCALWEQTPALQKNSDGTVQLPSLIERVFTVHRHMEGSGLDAGAAILTRLSGVGRTQAKAVIATIVNEEIAHVEFGSRWFRRLCVESALDPETVFRELLSASLVRSPRSEKPDFARRRLAGFTEGELEELSRATARVTAGF